MKRNRQNNYENSNADAGFGGHGYGYGASSGRGNGYPPQTHQQDNSSYGYANGYAGGGQGWQHPSHGDPTMTTHHHHHHQQQQQQQQQQPQFRGQWNDYNNAPQMNGAGNHHHIQHEQHSQGMSHYSQTQPTQQYDASQYGSSQPAGDHPNMDPPQPRKRQRAAKRRVRQPLSGPAGIWFRMNKKAASTSAAKDTKEGILKTNASDDAFEFEEAAVLAHQAHHVLTDRNRKARERREEEEMKGSGGGDDADDVVDLLYDEETGQNEKVPEGTTSTYEATLGRAWDIMCISMDRIVPEPSVYLHSHQRQSYHEIRTALDGSPCGKLRHFSLLSEVMGRDGPNRDIGIPGSGGRLRVGHLVVSIASVHNNNHCDWTVELRDETVMNSSSSPSSSTPGGGRAGSSVAGGDDGGDGASKGANSIMGWVEEKLLKDHPDWIRPGVVLYLRDAACAVFEAVSAGAEDDVGGSSGGPGGPGAPNSSLLSSGNGLDRMLLISESSVVCVWSPESHMDREDFLDLIERRNMARDHIKEEVTDLTQDNMMGEKPNNVNDVVFKTSPPSSQMVSKTYVPPKPSEVEVYEADIHHVKKSSTQEEGNAAIDLTSDDIGDKENQEDDNMFTADNAKRPDDADVGSLSSDVGQGTASTGASTLPSSNEDSHRKQEEGEARVQEHNVMDATARSVLSNPYARGPSSQPEAPKQNETTSTPSQGPGVSNVQEPVESSHAATVDESANRNGDVVINNPYQIQKEISSEAMPHVSVPANAAIDAPAASGGNEDLAVSSSSGCLPTNEDGKGETAAKNNEPPPKQNLEAKPSTQTTAASSIWETTGKGDGGEEMGDDHDEFSSGLSSTQDESLSPMVPSRNARPPPQKPPIEAPHSAKKAKSDKRAGMSGIFSGACEDMFDDLGEEDDDDDF